MTACLLKDFSVQTPPFRPPERVSLCEPPIAVIEETRDRLCEITSSKTDLQPIMIPIENYGL